MTKLTPICPQCGSEDIHGLATAVRKFKWNGTRWVWVGSWTHVSQEKSQFRCQGCSYEWENYEAPKSK